MKKSLSLIVAGLLSITCLEHAEAQQTYTRYEAHTPQGQEALASMRKAIATMKEIGCKNPISWYYQGAMHWTPDVSFGTYLEQNPLCPSYTKSSPDLSAAWDTCASHNSTGPSSGIHFLPWHRMFVIYFEDIIRRVSDDPKFAIPYWDYSTNYVMPKEFQAADGGSLYEESRRISLNQGKPIDDAAKSRISAYLKQLSQIRDYKTFNDQLNQGLHGFMHDYIGGQDGTFNPIYNTVVNDEVDPGCGKGCGMMAEVPSAGFDPIFWLHHGNVDRLYQNFIISNPNSNITLDQLESVKWPYNFFKVRGFTGEEVKLSMPEVLKDISSINYQYDDQPKLKAAEEAKAKAPLLHESVLVSTEPKIEVKRNKPAKLHISARTELKPMLLETSKSRLILEVTASYKESAKGGYDVFVGLPANIEPTSKEALEHYFVGTISFFVNDPQMKGGTHTFRYDITDELATAKIDSESFDISIVKSYGPEKGVITIDKATLQTLQ
ncbi:tyrosinase family protein [Nitrosomonas sp. Nm34]|uniref:tyrosinase family protein n=1 Tax=Nitrosomonas sp. Nm34 TaxID=1881055 RepID=UPI0008E9DA11|nr:tyrosinase family protein [Nitrosomonas sp. Nm34]SFJ01233.1 Common central domain of tyrosinase [Nitrosomonas sp. Nm34]